MIIYIYCSRRAAVFLCDRKLRFPVTQKRSVLDAQLAERKIASRFRLRTLFFCRTVKSGSEKILSNTKDSI